MALKYTVYQYDSNRNAVVMIDMEGKQLVIRQRSRLYLMSWRM